MKFKGKLFSGKKVVLNVTFIKAYHKRESRCRSSDAGMVPITAAKQVQNQINFDYQSSELHAT